MSFRLLAFRDLLRMQAQTLQTSTGKVWNLSVGSTIRAVYEANAGVALWMQWLVVLVAQQTRLATSNGTDVDTFGADFAFTRLPATYAGGLAVFARATAGQAAVVPVGTTVLTADRSQAFVVIGTGPYPLPAAALAVTVPVQAVLPGPGGNIQGGTLGLVGSALPGIDTVSNPAGFAGGVAAESDNAFRMRFALFIDSRSRATRSAIAYAIASFRQGLTYSIQDGPPSRPGTFTVYVDDGTGHPPQSLLSSLYLAVDAIRPVGTSFAVVGPSLLTAVVNLTVLPSLGYSKATTIGPVAAALLAYVNSLALGQTLNYARVVAIALGVPGVDNVLAISLNGGTADLGGLPGQVVRTTAPQVVVS